MLNFKNKYLQTKKKYVKQIGSAVPAPAQVYHGFQTQIDHNGPIFALSDVHGDMHALIITLRDCAQLIEKVNYGNGENADVVDPDIENNLNIDIADDENGYEETLGYRWIGGNSYVVICGDMIDPKRPGNNECRRDQVNHCNEYPQIEIKILRFINAINHQAMGVGGRIYKVLGNHEFENMQVNNNYTVERYVPRSDYMRNNYYRGDSRYNTFNYGHHGFNLLFQDGCGFLIKINNTIFAHGQLPDAPTTLRNVHDDNQTLNNAQHQNDFRDIFARYAADNRGLTGLPESTVWKREWAYTPNINTRINDGTQNIYCLNTIQQRIREFLGLGDITHIRVVLGHCVQHEATYFNEISSTFSNKISETPVSKTYNQRTIYNGLADLSNQDKIFGITMQCPKANRDNYVYHIDSGSSRGFDQGYAHVRTIQTENQYLFSKTPSILLIDNSTGEDRINIIKSKMRNTRIHLPRPNYETMVRRFNDLNYNNPYNYD